MLIEAFRRQFLTFFGEFEPQNVVGHRVDPKKALPYVTTRVFELLCATIHQRMTSVGEPGKKIKIKIKKKRPYISRISPGAPLQPIGTNFWLRVRLVDIINCAKLCRNRLRGLDSVRGRSLTIPIGLRYRR